MQYIWMTRVYDPLEKYVIVLSMLLIYVLRLNSKYIKLYVQFLESWCGLW